MVHQVRQIAALIRTGQLLARQILMPATKLFLFL
jgi:hypothetical protein